MNRRNFVRSGLAFPASAAALAAPNTGPGIYARLGVQPCINAVGTVTVLGGTLIAPEVKQAMEEASRSFVRLHELQEKAGRRLAELTGAEAAFVTAGASASLCLATCAVTAGGDPERINRLPDLSGMKSEIIIQKAHRTSYDHAFRMVGVKLIEVETADEMRRAINPKTAAVAAVLSHGAQGYKVELDELIRIAHDARVPVIVDAAAQLPPASNLRTFVKMGADLVAFSGGKNLRGPQCSGILMGRRDLVEAAYANSAPHNRFARNAKVGKEEIAGLVAAVELYLRRDHAAELREHSAKLNRISKRVEGVPSILTELVPGTDASHSPMLSIQWDETRLGVTLAQMLEQLREGNPSIEAIHLPKHTPVWKGLGIFPYNLQPGEEIVIADRVRQILVRRG